MKILDYWEMNYKKNGMVWGTEPSHLAKSAVLNRWFKEGQKILEIGGGYGRNGIFFARNGIEVVSLDISPSAKTMGILAADHANVDIRFVEGDAEKLSDLFGTEFDGIFCNFCLHLVGLEATRLIVGQLSLVLRASGTAVFSLLSTEDGDFGNGKRIADRIFERED